MSTPGANALTAIAATNIGAALAFRRSSVAYLEMLKAPIAALSAEGPTLSTAGYAALPRFAPPPPQPMPLWAITCLAAATLLVGAMAWRRCARLRLD